MNKPHRPEPHGNADDPVIWRLTDDILESIYAFYRLGREKTHNADEIQEPVNRFLTGVVQGRFTPAEGEATLCGIAVETDPRTGLAARISPVRIGGSLSQAFPEF